MKAPVLLAIATLALLAIPSCSMGRSFGRGYVLGKGLAYGSADSKDLLLDLARRDSGGGPFPTIVFIHSGYPISDGDRGQYEPVLPLAAARGYVAVSIDYRLVKVVDGVVHDSYPAQMKDAKAAVRWLRANAKKYAIDPGRIGAIGGGTAGTVALMLGLTRPEDGLEGSSGSPGQAGAVFGGAYDFATPAGNQRFSDYVGALYEKDKALWEQESPVAWERPGATPCSRSRATSIP